MSEFDEIREKIESTSLDYRQNQEFLKDFQNVMVRLMSAYLKYAGTHKDMDPEHLPRHIIEAMDELLIQSGYDVYLMSHAKPLSLGHAYFIDYFKTVLLDPNNHPFTEEDN